MIMHIITGLTIGGAEISLLNLLEYFRLKNLDAVVVSLGGRGQVAQEIEKLGFQVISLKRTYFFPYTLFKLFLTIKKIQPKIVQTWMHHSDFLGGIAAKVNDIKNIYWNITAACIDDPSLLKKHTQIVVKLLAKLSHFVPTKIISCSKEAIDKHTAIGYDVSKFLYIPNGINVQRFEYCPKAREQHRGAWNIDKEIVVGSLIKHAAIKGYDILLDAIKIAVVANKNLKLVLAGKDLNDGNQLLIEELAALNLRDRVLLLGDIRDVRGFLSAIDIFVLPSRSEAFPVALLEAMSCGRPCISTRVGDTALILEDTGKIVEPNSSAQIAQQIVSLAALSEEERSAIGIRASARIKENYRHDMIWAKYLDLYSGAT